MKGIRIVSISLIVVALASLGGRAILARADEKPPTAQDAAMALRQAQHDFDGSALALEREIVERMRPAREARTAAATAYALMNKLDPKCYRYDIATQEQADACKGKVWPADPQQAQQTPAPQVGPPREPAK